MISYSSCHECGISTRRTPAAAARKPERRGRARTDAAHDAILVRRFLAGDEKAFDEIVARHRSRMIQAAFPIVGNRPDAEEIAQDTFVRAWRGLAGFRGESALGSWLYRIARNLAKNRIAHCLRRRRDRMVSFDAPHAAGEKETLADVIESTTPGPVADAAMHEFSAAVAECMRRLTPSQREILEWLNVRHRSYEEIGSRLRLNQGTLKSRIFRARQNLQKLMAARCPELEATGPMRDWFEPAHSSARVRMCA
jgi:RNA polymerase sigma-70 factor (ECF subfamily)